MQNSTFGTSSRTIRGLSKITAGKKGSEFREPFLAKRCEKEIVAFGVSADKAYRVLVVGRPQSRGQWDGNDRSVPCRRICSGSTVVA